MAKKAKDKFVTHIEKDDIKARQAAINEAIKVIKKKYDALLLSLTLNCSILFCKSDLKIRASASFIYNLRLLFYIYINELYPIDFFMSI